MELPRQPLVLHLVHSLEGGGTERVLISLLRSFDHRDIRHAVVTLRDAGSFSAQLPDEVACIAMRTVGPSRTSGIRLARICARLRPSVIHARNVCTWSDAVVARLFNPGAKLVLGFHGLQNGGHFSWRDRCAARMARLMDAHFTTVSERGKSQMAHDLRLPIVRIEHLPNGIDLSRFSHDELHSRERVRESLGYQNSDRVIGIVGSLTEVKGHGVLFAAIANATRKMPDIRLLVVGDGPRRSFLESLARELALHGRVHFTGWREDVAALLRAMDVYVCASRSEGMSNAMMEAMAAGLPVVSTSVGDHPSLLQDGLAGLLVPPGDASALSKAVETVLGSPERASALGRRARDRIDEYSLARTVDSYERFYKNMMPCHIPKSQALACNCLGVSKSVIDSFRPRVSVEAPVK